MTGPVTAADEDREGESLSLLSESSAAAVIENAVRAAGAKGQTSEDLQRVLDWAVTARVQEAMLELVLTGRGGMFIADDGELTIRSFDAPAGGE